MLSRTPADPIQVPEIVPEIRIGRIDAQPGLELRLTRVQRADEIVPKVQELVARTKEDADEISVPDKF